MMTVMMMLHYNCEFGVNTERQKGGGEGGRRKHIFFLSKSVPHFDDKRISFPLSSFQSLLVGIQKITVTGIKLNGRQNREMISIAVDHSSSTPE